MLPSIYEHARKHDIAAQKKLSQNFLFDINITDKIVTAAGNINGLHVIEIGPGPGGLTRSILKKNPAKLTVIEKDLRCLNLLYEIKEYYPQLDIIQGDALKIKLSDITDKATIIANLPYQISTVLLFKWLDELPNINFMHLMFQKEVADRICAAHSTSDYGKLSVMTQIKAKAENIFTLPPHVFTPPPKVYSSIVKITPHEQQLTYNEINIIKKLTDEGFTKRRKMINKSFSNTITNLDIFNSLTIKPTFRAENLSINDYIKLAQAILNYN